MNNGSEEARSDSFNTIDYLLSKDYSPKRKISQFLNEDSERPNFVLHHKAQQYTVVRVYIDSLQSAQVRLYYSKFTPPQKEGTICIVHGYGENTDDYIQMAEYFAKNKFVVNMIDLRSFGYSGGLRVNQPIKGLLSDIQNLLVRCCQIGLPTYILCHGFGCLLVMALLEQNPKLPIAGVIAMSPLFSFPHFNKSSLLGKSVLWLLSTIFEDMIINNRIDPTSLTNNLQKVKSCIDGVFNYQFVSVKMVHQYSELSQKVLEDAKKFQYPLLMLYGAKNVIQSKEQVKRFYQLCGTKQKQSFVFKNGYHQLFKDEGAEEELFPKILEWITDQTSNKSQIKWKITKSLNLNVIRRTHKLIKYIFSLLAGILSILFALKWARKKRK